MIDNLKEIWQMFAALRWLEKVVAIAFCATILALAYAVVALAVFVGVGVWPSLPNAMLVVGMLAIGRTVWGKLADAMLKAVAALKHRFWL